jgi:translation elongation factor EF-1beta
MFQTFVFGLKMFYTALCSNDDNGEDELEEAKETLERLDAINEKSEPLLPNSQR